MVRYGVDPVIQKHIPVFQIQYQVLVLWAGIAITMDATALTHGKFDLYACAVEQNTVIARGGSFVIVGKVCPVTRLSICTVVKDQRVGRHEQDITIVTHSCTTQVSVREAVDVFVRIMIPTASVPTLKAGVRAQLHHAKGEGCPGICMSMAAGTYEGVDQIGQCTAVNSWSNFRVIGLLTRKHYLNKKQKEQRSIHGISWVLKIQIHVKKP